MIRYTENGEIKEMIIPAEAICAGHTEESIAKIDLELMTGRDGIPREIYVEPPKSFMEQLSESIASGERTVEEVNTILKEQFEARRKAMYAQKADPLFFQWKRGEATEADWLASIEEVKRLVPNPEYF